MQKLVIMTGKTILFPLKMLGDFVSNIEPVCICTMLIIAYSVFYRSWLMPLIDSWTVVFVESNKSVKLKFLYVELQVRNYPVLGYR